MAIRVLTDSTCDLQYAFMEENKSIVDFIGMSVSIEGKDYLDDLGKSLDYEFVYDKLREGVFPKTSQINVLTFFEKYKEIYTEGDTLFVLGLSSGLSGTINNAVLAKYMYEDEIGPVDIRVIDTVAASIGLGAIITEVISLIKSDNDADAIEKWLDINILRSNHWFAIDDLEHLEKGGRINKTTAKVGTALKVKPILTMTHKGTLEMYSAVRGRVKSIKFLVNKLLENYDRESEYTILIGHCDCESDALKLKELISNELYDTRIYISKISATISTHVGNGMLAIAFIGKDIREKKRLGV